MAPPPCVPVGGGGGVPGLLRSDAGAECVGGDHSPRPCPRPRLESWSRRSVGIRHASQVGTKLKKSTPVSSRAGQSGLRLFAISTPPPWHCPLRMRWAPPGPGGAGDPPRPGHPCSIAGSSVRRQLLASGGSELEMHQPETRRCPGNAETESATGSSREEQRPPPAKNALMVPGCPTRRSPDPPPRSLRGRIQAQSALNKASPPCSTGVSHTPETSEPTRLPSRWRVSSGLHSNTPQTRIFSQPGAGRPSSRCCRAGSWRQAPSGSQTATSLLSLTWPVLPAPAEGEGRGRGRERGRGGEEGEEGEGEGRGRGKGGGGEGRERSGAGLHSLPRPGDAVGVDAASD